MAFTKNRQLTPLSRRYFVLDPCDVVLAVEGYKHQTFRLRRAGKPVRLFARHHRKGAGREKGVGYFRETREALPGSRRRHGTPETPLAGYNAHS
jgi:hypothetical protein